MKPFIWAHRGCRTEAPENTLEAFALAVEQGADGIELDIHLTKDGEIVVTHDETLERVSDGHGPVSDMTLAELKSLNFSKEFPDYAVTRIPTLREVYELISPSDLTINVELKSGVVLYEGIEQKVVDLTHSMGMAERVFYSSFNHYCLKEIMRCDPDARTGILYIEALVDPQIYASRIGAYAIHPLYHTLISPGVIDGCRDLGIKIHPWTVNDPHAISSLIKSGVDAIITDVPKVALGLLGED